MRTEAAGRASVAAALHRWFPELCPLPPGPRPRVLMGEEEIVLEEEEQNEDGVSVGERG